MSQIAIFSLVSFGLTQILLYSEILKIFRPKWYLFKCSMCMGFWTGLLIWSISGKTILFNFDGSWVTGLCLGFLSSGVNYILDKLFTDCGLNLNLTQ